MSHEKKTHPSMLSFFKITSPIKIIESRQGMHSKFDYRLSRSQNLLMVDIKGLIC